MAGCHPSPAPPPPNPSAFPHTIIKNAWSWGLPCPLSNINSFLFIYIYVYIHFIFFIAIIFVFLAGADEIADGGVGRVVSIYQSTCHKALSNCQSDLQCRKHLDPFLRYCNGAASSGLAGSADTCHRDLCMQALQGFYKDAPLQWSLEVAFCVCK